MHIHLPFVSTPATNKTTDWLKRKTKYRHTSLELLDLKSEPIEPDSPAKELVQELNDKSRIVLTLHYFEQLSIYDISIALTIPQGTVKSRLFKARRELKQLWEKSINE